MEERKASYIEAAKYVCLENLQNVGPLNIEQTLNLDYAGREECQPGHSFGPFIRRSYLINVVTQGCGTLYTRGEAYHITAGQAFVIFPGEETVYTADDVNPWIYCWLAFRGKIAKDYLDSIGATLDNPVITLTKTDELVQCVKNILQASQLTYANELVRLGNLFSFLGYLSSFRRQEEQKEETYRYTTHTYVQYAIDYIRYHYDEKIKISNLAEYIGINRSYLTRSFKKEIGMSPQEFLINYRLEKAAGMLKNSEDSVNLIANKVGYMDQMAFSKAFKEKYGFSPQKFRQEPIEIVENEIGKGNLFHTIL